MTDSVAADRLKSFVARIEKLAEEKSSIAEDIKQVFSEAHGAGYDKKALREVIRLRKIDRDARVELEALVDTYERAIGGA